MVYISLEVNHKEHRTNVYEQWGNKIISKINMWEELKFKSINVLLEEETTTKRYCLSDFIDRCILTFWYNLIENPR